MLSMKAREIAEFIGGEINGNGDIDIHSAASTATATAGQIAFVLGDVIPESNASCLIVSQKTECKAESFIRVDDPKLAFALAANKLHPHEWKSGRHETAHIAPDTDIKAGYLGAFVSIGENTSIGEATEIHDGTKIGRNVEIGKRTVIYPNCVIYDGVKIGDNCVIHAGTIIGADGFGYVRDTDGKYLQFPQIGNVIIEDNVEIGANTCIDRGALGTTRIGEGTKIDNLVQVGHNVDIGKHCVIAAQTGISGSVIIEDGCIIGGQVGFGDHSHIKSGAVIGSQAGVLPGKIVRPGVWWGTPIQTLEDFKRRNALLNRIEKIVQDIADLKRSRKEK